MSTLPPVIGRYRILGLLGKGAMGTVYRGRDESLEREVAVKVMSLGQADEEARHRFLREGKAAGRLQHPNIVTIYELGEHEGQPFMALELLDGMDLQRAIEAGIKPDPKSTLPIVLHLLAGLGHAHENGIVHRDVKPSNLFLPRGRPAKIMDFGVARLAGGHTTTGTVIGTPNYMSPEQAKGAALDGRSDLFSAGLILFELVTGEKAYDADSVVAVIFKIVQEDPDFGRIPKGPTWARLRDVLRRSLQKKAEDRYPDARAMAADLEGALRDLGGAFDPVAGADQALVHGHTPRPAPVPTFVPPAPAAVAPAPAPRHAAAPAETPGATAEASSRRSMLIGGGVLAIGVIALLVAGSLLLGRGRPRDDPGRRAPSGAPSPAPSPSAPSAGLPGGSLTTAPSPTAAPAKGAAIRDLAPSPPASSAGAVPTPIPAEPSAPAGPAPANARLDRANEHMEKGRYAQALAEAKAVLAKEPDNADAKALAGDAEAALVIEDAVKNARAALKAGDREKALAEAKKGLAVNPSDRRLLDIFREATQ